jgi:hypothetical protein
MYLKVKFLVLKIPNGIPTVGQLPNQLPKATNQKQRTKIQSPNINYQKPRTKIQSPYISYEKATNQISYR